MSSTLQTASLKNLFVRSMTSSWVEGMIRPFLPPLLPIFMLHQFQNPESGRPGHDPQMVSDSLKCLKTRGYAFLDLDEALAEFGHSKVSRHKTVVFTLDDGFWDQVSTAKDVFSINGCPVTCFLITDFIDGHSWPWDSQISFLVLSSPTEELTLTLEPYVGVYDTSTLESKRRTAHDLKALIKTKDPRSVDFLLSELVKATNVSLPHQPPKDYQPISWGEARRLEGRGMRFGSHSQSHRILSSLSDLEVSQEIEGAKQRIEQELADPSKVFCYPVGAVGHFGAREMQLAEQAGYKAAASAVSGYLTPSTYTVQRFSLPRFSFPDTIADLMQYCSWIEYVKSKVFRP